MSAGPRHVILVGLPGAGKTAVGHAAARQLGWDWVDLDAEIEQRAGMSVAEIFAGPGEGEFRRLEADATLELARRGAPALVSAGGGWIANGRARELVPGHWAILYLRVAAPEAADRLGEGATERPLLAGFDSPEGLRERLEEMAEERVPLYERADAVVETGGRSLEDVVSETVRVVRKLAGLAARG